MPFGDRRFDFGINLAWLNNSNGHDLGYNPYFAGPAPHPDWGIYWSTQLVRTYLADIAARGFTVVRMWAFEKLEGLEFDASTFNPARVVTQRLSNGHAEVIETPSEYEKHNIPLVTGLQAVFCENVVDLMRLAEEARLEIYWTLLSPANYFFDPLRHHEWAVHRMLSDTQCRTAFVQKALVPFLEILRPFNNSVYAIDLINEPEGFAYARRRGRTLSPNILKEFALEYIREASRAVRSASHPFKISAGFRSRKTIEHNYTHLEPELDFFDVHHYGTGGLDCKPISGSIKPTILGEVGYRNWRGKFRPTDRQQLRVVDRIISEAMEKKFRGCLVWRYTPCATTDDGNNLLHKGRDSSNRWRPALAAIERRAREIALLNDAKIV